MKRDSSTVLQDPLTTQPRQCREISGPSISTLGYLLWKNVTLDVDFTLKLFTAICDVLVDQHQKGYAAGNLHPDGVIVVSNGESVSSVHFKREGVTSAFGNTEEISLLIEKNHYISPEQMQGLSPSPCSDIYAIGCMLHVALTGAPPSVQSKILNLVDKGEIKRAMAIAERKKSYLKVVLKTCLNEDETKRYRSAAELKADLMRIQQEIVPVGKTALERKQTGKRFAWMPALCILIASFVLVVSSAVNLGKSHPIVIDGVWNKPANQYAYGDPFSITMLAQKECYVYLFYINDQNETLCIYPARFQEHRTIAPGEPLPLDNVMQHSLRVDSKPGRLVLVSVAANLSGAEITQNFIGNSDWTDKWPAGYWLKFSGSELLSKLDTITSKNPDLVYYSVQNAPRATQQE